MLRVLIFRK